MPTEYNNRKEAEARRLKILKQVFKNSINDEFEFDKHDKVAFYNDYGSEQVQWAIIDTYKYVMGFVSAKKKKVFEKFPEVAICCVAVLPYLMFKGQLRHPISFYFSGLK